MFELYKLGLTDKDIKIVLEQLPELIELTEEEISKKINLLELIGCHTSQIRNIIITNPYYLESIKEDVINLVNKLTSLGITYPHLLFDSNPYFLNKEVFEIEDYIKLKINKGQLIENIINELEQNPYIIDEF